jgi:hypothetical protein
MRDIDTIDSELRLVAALPRADPCGVELLCRSLVSLPPWGGCGRVPSPVTAAAREPPDAAVNDRRAN